MHSYSFSAILTLLLWFLSISSNQFVIVVVDSTDRERISVTKEELYRMLAHEVSIRKTESETAIKTFYSNKYPFILKVNNISSHTLIMFYRYTFPTFAAFVCYLM